MPRPPVTPRPAPGSPRDCGEAPLPKVCGAPGLRDQAWESKWSAMEADLQVVVDDGPGPAAPPQRASLGDAPQEALPAPRAPPAAASKWEAMEMDMHDTLRSDLRLARAGSLRSSSPVSPATVAPAAPAPQARPSSPGARAGDVEARGIAGRDDEDDDGDVSPLKSLSAFVGRQDLSVLRTPRGALRTPRDASRAPRAETEAPGKTDGQAEDPCLKSLNDFLGAQDLKTLRTPRGEGAGVAEDSVPPPSADASAEVSTETTLANASSRSWDTAEDLLPDEAGPLSAEGREPGSDEGADEPLRDPAPADGQPLLAAVPPQEVADAGGDAVEEGLAGGMDCAHFDAVQVDMVEDECAQDFRAPVADGADDCAGSPASHGLCHAADAAAGGDASAARTAKGLRFMWRVWHLLVGLSALELALILVGQVLDDKWSPCRERLETCYSLHRADCAGETCQAAAPAWACWWPVAGLVFLAWPLRRVLRGAASAEAAAAGTGAGAAGKGTAGGAVRWQRILLLLLSAALATVGAGATAVAELSAAGVHYASRCPLERASGRCGGDLCPSPVCRRETAFSPCVCGRLEEEEMARALFLKHLPACQPYEWYAQQMQRLELLVLRYESFSCILGPLMCSATFVGAALLVVQLACCPMMLLSRWGARQAIMVIFATDAELEHSFSPQASGKIAASRPAKGSFEEQGGEASDEDRCSCASDLGAEPVGGGGGGLTDLRRMTGDALRGETFEEDLRGGAGWDDDGAEDDARGEGAEAPPEDEDSADSDGQLTPAFASRAPTPSATHRPAGPGADAAGPAGEVPEVAARRPLAGQPGDDPGGATDVSAGPPGRPPGPQAASPARPSPGRRRWRPWSR